VETVQFVSMPPLFASFRVFRAQTSDLLRIIHVNESRFQIRLIRVIRGLPRRSLGEGGLKKFSRFEICRELRPEFPGEASE
jgi:hypothetical protein